jgi:hypothetical protein
MSAQRASLPSFRAAAILDAAPFLRRRLRAFADRDEDRPADSR